MSKNPGYYKQNKHRKVLRGEEKGADYGHQEERSNTVSAHWVLFLPHMALRLEAEGAGFEKTIRHW